MAQPDDGELAELPVLTPAVRTLLRSAVLLDLAMLAVTVLALSPLLFDRPLDWLGWSLAWLTARAGFGVLVLAVDRVIPPVAFGLSLLVSALVGWAGFILAGLRVGVTDPALEGVAWSLGVAVLVCLVLDLWWWRQRHTPDRRTNAE